ncbi:MAG: glycosyltransferase family 9 protein [Gemmatimonadaceae bacterium]
MAHFSLKALEHSWKRVSMRALAATVRTPPRGAAPDWDARPWRVLYIRYGRIGDMIMSTGVLRAIADSHTTIWLDVIASPANITVLDGIPFVRDVIPFDRHDWRSFPRVWRRLRRARYDVVIDPMVLTPSVTTLLLLAASGAPYRIGIGGRSNDFIYSMPVQARDASAHHIEQEAVTATPFGVPIEGTDWRPELVLTTDERARAELVWRAGGGAGVETPRLLANISASLAHRAWPDDRYSTALRHVRARWPQVRVIVVSAPHDADRAVRIATASDVQYVPTPKLRDALALVGTASAVFTPDTSIAHAASAFRKPAIVMLVRGSSIFSPYRNAGHAVYSQGGLLTSLGAGPVIHALDAVMRELAV